MTAKSTILALLFLIVAQPAVAGDWRFRELASDVSGYHGAIVLYEPSHPEGIRLAFKCGYPTGLRLLLGVYMPIHKGMDQRHRVLIKVGPEERFRFRVRKLLESGVPAGRFYSGLDREVRKLWFLSRKAIAYRTYGRGLLESRLAETVNALRYGYGRAEIHIGKKIASISLKGSARALEQFVRACNVDLDE